MRKLVLVLASVAVLLMAVGAAAEEGGAADGKTAFESLKCTMCHSVSTAGVEAKSEKMFKGDLVDLEHDAAWMVQYMKQEIDVDGEPHKKEFKGSDEELQAIVDWLLEQKTG